MIDYSSPAPGMKITVVGDGAWGTALALLLFDKGYEVRVWGAFPEYTRELIQSRQNYRYLPGIPLPDDLVFTNDLATALQNTRLIIMAVPSQFMRDVARKVYEAHTEPTPLVSVAKGIESTTMKRMSQVIQEETHCLHVAALSGPSHAEEVARHLPTAVTAAATTLKLAEFIQETFSCSHFRVYTNKDIVGVELCATLKNIIAIGAGAIDGLGYGDNAKSALLTRGLVEMVRFGTAMGGKVESFFGLAGTGDLITTCFSPHGRNRAFGERLAQGMSPADALKASRGVVEGYRNAKIIHELAKKLKIEMPLTEAIYSVLYEGKELKSTVFELMMRERKSEHRTGSYVRRWLKLFWLRLRVSLMMD